MLYPLYSGLILHVKQISVCSMKNEESRPISPHLGIYKPQITSVMSISHRITGVALFFGMLFLLWFSILVVYSVEALHGFMVRGIPHPFMLKMSPYLAIVMGSMFFKFVLVVLSYCLFFHMCAGVRYLFWSCGKGFSLSAVNCSAWLIFSLSLLMTIVLWYVV